MSSNHGNHSCCYLVHSRSCKSKRHNDWFQSSAKAMDLILDESLYPPLVMSFLVSIIIMPPS